MLMLLLIAAAAVADEDVCSPFPCKNNGVCLRRTKTVSDPRGTSVTVSTFYTCYCPRGWTGDHCEVDTREFKPAIQTISCPYSSSRRFAGFGSTNTDSLACTRLSGSQFVPCVCDIGGDEYPGMKSVFQYAPGADGSVYRCSADKREISPAIMDGLPAYVLSNNGTACGVVYRGAYSAQVSGSMATTGDVFEDGLIKVFLSDFSNFQELVAASAISPLARVCMQYGPFPRGMAGARASIFVCSRLNDARDK